MALLGNFADALALILLERWAGDFEHLDPIPFALEQMRPLDFSPNAPRNSALR